MPRTATRWSRRISETIGVVAEHVPPGMAELGRGLSAGRRRRPHRGGCSATRRWRRPTAACSPKPATAARERQIERARDAWYRGFVAEAIDRFCRHEKVLDASGRRHGGLLTADDMARWEAPVEAPLTYDYRGYTVAKGGPWSQGPVLLQQLALLQGFDLDDLDPLGPDFVHLVVECAKLAFADREAWYGDPDFVDVPMATLLGAAYNDARRKLVGERRLARIAARAAPTGAMPRVLVGGDEAVVAAAGIGEPTVGRWRHRRADGQRTRRRRRRHLPSRRHRPLGQHGVGDAERRLAAELAGHPGARLLPRHAACRCSGSTRVCRRASHPASARAARLSPSLAFKDGEPYMAFGTPGGDQQDQWSTLLFLHHVHHGMNLQEAIDCPEFHNDHMPSSFYPRAANPGARRARRPLSGSDARRRSPSAAIACGSARPGRTAASPAAPARQTPEGTVLKAGANPRGMQGYAVGR